MSSVNQPNTPRNKIHLRQIKNEECIQKYIYGHLTRFEFVKKMHIVNIECVLLYNFNFYSNVLFGRQTSDVYNHNN